MWRYLSTRFIYATIREFLFLRSYLQQQTSDLLYIYRSRTVWTQAVHVSAVFKTIEQMLSNAVAL
jgi:hypothetical protein